MLLIHWEDTCGRGRGSQAELARVWQEVRCRLHSLEDGYLNTRDVTKDTNQHVKENLNDGSRPRWSV